VAVLTLLCGHENWTVIRHKERIEAEEMKAPKSFVGFALHDHKTNRGITAELSTCNFNDVIVDYRRSWTYLLAMNDKHITKFEYEEETIQKLALTLLLMVMGGGCSWLKIVLTDCLR
jgi:hypothetical protein